MQAWFPCDRLCSIFDGCVSTQALFMSMKMRSVNLDPNPPVQLSLLPCPIFADAALAFQYILQFTLPQFNLLVRRMFRNHVYTIPVCRFRAGRIFSLKILA